ncbi:MAG: sodium/solute symporter [Phycisphaerae bacterium]|nr:sodium/solute symporter [Phycisphaerae bacterium]
MHEYNTFDLTVFLGYFVLVVAIGFWTSRRQKASVGDYFRGGNRLPWYAIGFSIVAAGISSEQFVGEVGYAYKIGLPVANWEWLVFPALSILLWIFVPLYVRNRVTTMPEYLERRFGGRARTLYALLMIASYVFVNFALVFYTGGFALHAMWGVNKVAAVWGLALVTGAYTVYGGLTAVAWTSSFQCALLMGGGLYVFFAGMSKIGWDFGAIIGTGEQAHLMTSANHEVPWTALVILMLSTNVWYYATNQYINQRCLAARDEWHAKMGVLLAGGLQILLPLATCFPGMVYRVINPDLSHADAAYPSVVAAVVPTGLRGLVAAAIVGAIMSTVSGLVNSTSTMVTLDIFQRWKGRDWSEDRLVRFGKWSGAVALLIGALFAPVVMRWESMFRYAQDIWAPMAAPVVVVFLSGALWKRASERGAVACIWLAILTVPFTLAKGVLADADIHFLPENLANSMVFAGAIGLISLGFVVSLADGVRLAAGVFGSVVVGVLVLGIAAYSPVAIALVILIGTVGLIGWFCVARVAPAANMWDRSMLAGEGAGHWYKSLWLWWAMMAVILTGIYAWLW